MNDNSNNVHFFSANSHLRLLILCASYTKLSNIRNF